MDKQYNLTDYNLKINDKLLLSNFSMSIKIGDMICLLGESGTGKSLLLKELKEMELSEINDKIQFYCGEKKVIKNWQDEFNYQSMSKEWQEFLNKFFTNLKNYDIRCALISKIIMSPDFFFCEDIHKYFNTTERKELWDFLRSQNISVFYVTNDVEETVFFDYLIVIKNNKIVMEGKTFLILKEEKLMKLLGFSLPFYVNMSIQLGYYGLLHEVCLKKEKLEELLCPLK